MSSQRFRSQVTGMRPNYFYSITGVTLILVMLGFFGLLVLQGRQLLSQLREKLSIITELKEAEEPGQLAELKSFMQAQPFLKSGSLEFISKEDGVKMMQQEFGDNFLKLDMANPLYDILSFHVNGNYLHADSLTGIRAMLKSNPLVIDVYYQEGLASKLFDNFQKISLISLALAAFLVVVAAFLIHNTIRLALYANRFIIKNMELVGATWEFISRPFILKSLLHGFLSGALAVGILTLLQFWAMDAIPELKNLITIPVYSLLAGVILLTGILISVTSTYFTINKYLRLRIDELY
jgi:cell division transport system permease protein